MRNLRATLIALALLTLIALPALATLRTGASLRFQLTVTGTPPEDATFFAEFPLLDKTVADFVGIAQLTDPDGDGVYKGGANTDGHDYTPAGYYDIRFVQGVGTRLVPVEGGEVAFPGEPITVIRDFGVLRIVEDARLPASVSYDEEPDSPTVPDTGGGGTATSRAHLASVLAGFSLLLARALAPLRGRRRATAR